MPEMYGDHGPQQYEYGEFRGEISGHGQFASLLNHQARLGWRIISAHMFSEPGSSETQCIIVMERKVKKCE